MCGVRSGGSVNMKQIMMEMLKMPIWVTSDSGNQRVHMDSSRGSDTLSDPHGCPVYLVHVACYEVSERLENCCRVYVCQRVHDDLAAARPT